MVREIVTENNITEDKVIYSYITDYLGCKCYNHKTRFKCHLIRSLFHSAARIASQFCKYE